MDIYKQLGTGHVMQVNYIIYDEEISLRIIKG